MRAHHGSVRFGSLRWLSALVLIGLTTTVAFAAEIYGSAYDVTPPKGVPAGTKWIVTKGTYTLDAGQIVEKVEVKYYKIDANGNETFVAGDIVPDPIGSPYATNFVQLDSGVKYKARVDLYVNGDVTKSVANTSFSFTAP